MAGGRPSEYSIEVASDICSHLAAGSSLVKICRDENKPGVSTVYRWLLEQDKFREMYARAREDQADTLADEILDIADDGRNDTYTTSDGEVVTNHDVINRSKLRVDSRKWIAAKLKPRKYGDRVEQHHSGTVNVTATPQDENL